MGRVFCSFYLRSVKSRGTSGSGEDQSACWSVVRAIHRGSQPLWSLCVFPQSVHGVSIYRLYLSPVGPQDGKCRHLLIYRETAIQLTTDVF